MFNVQIAVLPKNEEFAKFFVVADYEDRIAKAKEILTQMGIKDVKPLIKVKKNGNKRRLGKANT